MRVPSNPFGANVTIFDPSMSVASINAALNATPPAGGGNREFFFLPVSADFDGDPALAVTPTVHHFRLDGFQSWSRLGNGCYCNVTSVITTPVKRGVTLHALFTGEILGSTPPGTTPTGATVGGAFNLVNLDGVSASVPFSTSPWGGTSAWPYSDLAGHGVTARIRDFPTAADYPHARHDGPVRDRSGRSGGREHGRSRAHTL